MANPLFDRRAVRSWVLYDVANSAFVLIVVTTVMPLFFKDVASRGIENAVSTAHWGFANAAAALMVALLAPVLGTLADYRGFKKRFLAGFILSGVLATAALSLIDAGSWLFCLAVYIPARFAYAGANLFYDALLVDVAPENRMDWISASGYAWGYIGSVVPFIAVMVLLGAGAEADPSVGIAEGPARIAFLIVAVWWLVFSLPILKNVHQQYYLPPDPQPLRRSFQRLAATFKAIRRYRSAFMFLCAYFFYIDGVGTIITMATAYGRDIGLGVAQLIGAILMIQIIAFPCALGYGRLARTLGTKTMLYFGICVYAIITAVSFCLPSLPMNARTVVFWVLAALVASSMGGIQALSRSYFGRLIPPQNAAEFFGFYNVSGKFASIMGPFLVGLGGRLTGDSRYGILSILMLFVIGGWLLSRVPSAGQGGSDVPPAARAVQTRADNLGQHTTSPQNGPRP